MVSPRLCKLYRLRVTVRALSPVIFEICALCTMKEHSLLLRESALSAQYATSIDGEIVPAANIRQTALGMRTDWLIFLLFMVV